MCHIHGPFESPLEHFAKTVGLVIGLGTVYGGVKTWGLEQETFKEATNLLAHLEAYKPEISGLAAFGGKPAVRIAALDITRGIDDLLEMPMSTTAQAEAVLAESRQLRSFWPIGASNTIDLCFKDYVPTPTSSAQAAQCLQRRNLVQAIAYNLEITSKKG